jgi:hypothetical protein
LNLGDGCGNLGPQTSAKFFCCWQFIIGVGQQIDWLKEVCPIQISVPFAIKKKRPYNTFELHVL